MVVILHHLVAVQALPQLLLQLCQLCLFRHIFVRSLIVVHPSCTIR